MVKGANVAPAERVGPDDEKVTLNIGSVDLGRIDLLVREGMYSSRTDFIRDAVRGQLERHTKLVDEVVTRKEYVVGFTMFTRSDLERLRDQDKRMSVRVVGMLRFARDVPVDLVAAVVEDISILGSLRGPDDVVDYLRDMERGALR